MKKIFYFFIILTLIIFITSINIFLKINSNFNHIIGIDINLILYLIIYIICIITINKIFKKANLKTSKNYRRDIKTAFANSFFISSLISIIYACIIYGFLKNILEIFNLKEGIINYCIFATKIWFISSPFIGLEVAVLKYFCELEYFKTPIKLLILKLLLFFIISFLFFEQRKASCFIYAKTLSDIIFLIYYTKICFDITLNNSIIRFRRY